MVSRHRHIPTHLSGSIQRYIGNTTERETLKNICQEQDWDFWDFQSIRDFLIQSHGILYYLPENRTTWKALVFAQSTYDSAELLFVYTQPKHRGSGLGGALLSHLIESLKSVGNQQAIFLEVRPSNVSAIHLYEALGWRHIDTRKHYYRDGEDAYVYKLNLTHT